MHFITPGFLIFRSKRETQDKRQRILFLTVKTPTAETHEHLTSSPFYSHVIFLPVFLRIIMFRIFCWEGKCLQHFFRCQEAFLNWKHNEIWCQLVMLSYNNENNNGCFLPVKCSPSVPTHSVCNGHLWAQSSLETSCVLPPPPLPKLGNSEEEKPHKNIGLCWRSLSETSLVLGHLTLIY